MRPHRFAHVARVHGPIVYSHSPFGRVLILTSPVAVREVLGARGAPKPPVYGDYFDPITYGHASLLTSLGDDWLQRRKNLVHAFSMGHLREGIPVFHEKVDRLCELLAVNGPTKAVNVEDAMIRLTVDVISSVAFENFQSNTLEALGDVPSGTHDLPSIIKNVLIEFVFRRLEKWRHFLPAALFPDRVRAMAALRELHTTAENILAHMRTRAAAGGLDTRGLTYRLLHATDGNGQPAEDGLILADIVIFLIAGHDTTGHTYVPAPLALFPVTIFSHRSSILQRVEFDALHILVLLAHPRLAWTLHLLASHPHVEARLLAEVDVALDSRRHPSSEDLAKMPFLNAVLKERCAVHY